MDKLQKTSNIINKLLTIALVLCIIGALVNIYMTALGAFREYEPGSFGISGLTLGNLVLRLEDYLIPDGYRTVFRYALAMTVIESAFAITVILLLKKVFRPMAAGQPFHTAVSTALKQLAWVVLLCGIVRVVVESAMWTAMYNIYDLGNLLLNDTIRSVSLEVVSDGSFIPAFIVLLLLSHVFRYGEQLQQLSDETL